MLHFVLDHYSILFIFSCIQVIGEKLKNHDSAKSFSRLHRGYENKLLKFTIFEKNNRETFGPLDLRLIDTLRDNLSQRVIENVSNMLTAGTHGYDF